MKQPQLSSIARAVGWMIFVIICIWALLSRQWIYDQIRYRTYQPTQQISEIASDIDLTDYGKMVFYASQPSIESRDAFNKSCDDHEASTAILGCYKNLTIHIYQIDNQDLDGIMETTAAHELLHAAYDRLAWGERGRINTELRTRVGQLRASDKDFDKRMSFYDDLSGNDYLNEVYAVLGTEVSVVGTELESHYQKYFAARNKIVKYYDSYSGVFEALEKEANDLAASLNDRSEVINSRVEDYNNDTSALSTDIAGFNTRADSGYFSSQEQFVIERSQLMARVDELEAERDMIDDMIAKYNSDKARLDEINIRHEELNQVIDSSLSTAPQVQ